MLVDNDKAGEPDLCMPGTVEVLAYGLVKCHSLETSIQESILPTQHEIGLKVISSSQIYNCDSVDCPFVKFSYMPFGD